MGSLTRTQLITEALELAGNTGLTTRANTWIELALSKLYASHAWPILRTRYGSVPLASGATSIDIGDSAASPALASSAYISDKLIKIKRVAIVDAASNAGYKGEIFLDGDGDVGAAEEPLFTDSSTSATPFNCVIESSNGPTAYADAWRWRLNFSQKTDKAYTMLVVAQRRPAALSGDSAIPLYQNDETIVQALFCYALKHQQDPRFPTENGILREMISEDRIIYGRAHGSEKLRLSRRRFRQGIKTWRPGQQ